MNSRKIVTIGQKNFLQLLILFMLVSVSFPALSRATEIAGTSSTYLTSRETSDKVRLLPLYEYLDIAAQNSADGSLSAHIGAWGRYDLKDESFGTKTNNDLQYGYMSYRKNTANAIVNLGRVMVFEGVANERVDGLFARTDLAGGFGISAYGGVPVETEIDLPGNNSIYGGRLSHSVDGLYRVGVSYLKEEKNSADFRKEEGIDLWIHPVSKVDISGWSYYNSITKDWMSHVYNLVLGPFSGLRLITDASSINYKDYFFNATGAVFSVKTVQNPGGILDPNEKARILGETASYDLTALLNVSADYKKYSYEIAGDAKYFGANLRYGAVEAGGAGLSYHRMDGDTDRLKYNEYRVYAYKKIEKTDLAVDVIDVKYDAAINGVTNTYSASIAGQYDLTEAWKVGADAEYSKNPDFNKDIRVFLKAIYRFDTGSGAKKGA